MTQAYPLHCPAGWPRTPAHKRDDGDKFKRVDWRGGYTRPTINDTRRELADELARLGARIAKLARQGKLLDETFKVVRAALYPDAAPDQIVIMRTMFFAGAAELMALQMYGVSEGAEPAPEDNALFGQIVEEVERRHGHTVQLAFTRFGGKAQ